MITSYYRITDTSNYLMPGSGKPWQQQYQINETHDTDITGWVADRHLPEKLGFSQAIVTKNRVYLLGGWTNIGYTPDVYTASINDNGTLEKWTKDTPLPGILVWSQAIVTKNRVYLLGGWNGSQITNMVYTAPINVDGTLGAWSIDTPLPLTLGLSQAIITKDRVYLLGGRSGNVYTNAVYTAHINADGTLGTWYADNPLPGILGQSQAIVTKDRVYLLGGYDGAQYTNIIYTALINTDGILGTWTTGTSLPEKLADSQAIVTKNRVYLLGGYNGNQHTNAVYTAPINPDGTLGTWGTGTSLPSGLCGSSLFVTKNKVYLVGELEVDTCTIKPIIYRANISGGLNDYFLYYGTIDTSNHMTPGSGRSWQQQYQINETQYTDITGWVSDTPLPTELVFSQSIVTKDRVYLLGGWNDSQITNTVYTAPINVDGTLGTWSTDTPLLGELANSQAIVTKNRVYLLGGRTNDNFTSTVYTALINHDGTLGTWSTDAPLPIELAYSQAIITKNRVYLLGGRTNRGYTSNVYTAPINDDGTLGAWSADNPLPIRLGESQAIVTNNRVYLLSGYGEFGYSNAIYTATIDSNGYLSIWTYVGSIPDSFSNSQAFVTKNRVYLLGGHKTNLGLSNVYYADINTDGILETWTTGSPLPGGLGCSSLFVTKNNVYLVSGYINSTTPVSKIVYRATISGGLNDYLT